MTINDFKALDNVGQAKELGNGTFLAWRIHQDFHVVLYNLYGFYVEVYCSLKTDHFPIMKPFGSTDQLRPYLDKMEIKELQQA